MTKTLDERVATLKHLLGKLGLYSVRLSTLAGAVDQDECAIYKCPACGHVFGHILVRDKERDDA